MSSRRQTVLIVEDELDLRGLYRTALMLAGYDVTEAGDGFEALKHLDTSIPDLVVLDLNLPHLDGRAVRQELAAQVHTRNIPVVVVTGASGPDLDHIDADCVLNKPVTPDRLIQVIRRCLAAGSRTLRA